MPKQRSRWFWGCGIGCAVVLLIAVVIGGGSVLFIRGIVKDFDVAINLRHELEERYGAATDYTPSPAGTIGPDRVELFLSIRDSLVIARSELATTFTALTEHVVDDKESSASRRGFFSSLREGIRLAELMADFYAARNRTLLQQGMGFGEYTYIYCLAYYSLLQKMPADGLQDIIIHTGGGGETEIIIGAEDREQAEQALQHAQRQVRKSMLSILQNQLRDLPPTLEAGHGDTWREQLTAEIALLREDPDLFPWQHELPERIAASLTPYRTRLLATYNPVTNIFELTRNRKKGWSITAE